MSTDCYSNSQWTGVCASNDGTKVDVGASVTIPGADGFPTTPGTDDSTNPANPANPTRPGTIPAPAEPDCTDPFCDRGGFVVVAPPDVTLADLASFQPARPTLTGQPEGFGVVGMPANLVATASEQSLSGQILGWDVEVRFVPTAFVFEYGDGTSARTGSGGASWEALGQAQFTPTATSHVYRARGTYPVAVTVEYAASVSFGARWRAVPGVVSASTGGYVVRVVEVRTALVDRTCDEDPSGPAC
ncbi:hypothetical protein ABZ477_16875 [Microbacterium sp. NPDC019599]|uniref:hypothetical protein n=1 Tax=Microbacterium sp. NPDC019599 TaxID=3154690 RepID=UPI0033E27CA5